MRSIVSKNKPFKSKHVYEIMEIKPVKRIDSTKVALKITIINIDTKALLERRGFYFDREGGEIYLMALENIPNVFVPQDVKLKMPCEIVGGADGFFFMQNL